jgi:hypothetical protein
MHVETKKYSIRFPTNHTATVRAITMSPSRLFTASDDTTIRIFALPDDLTSLASARTVLPTWKTSVPPIETGGEEGHTPLMELVGSKHLIVAQAGVLTSQVIFYDWSTGKRDASLPVTTFDDSMVEVIVVYSTDGSSADVVLCGDNTVMTLGCTLSTAEGKGHGVVTRVVERADPLPVRPATTKRAKAKRPAKGPRSSAGTSPKRTKIEPGVASARASSMVRRLKIEPGVESARAGSTRQTSKRNDESDPADRLA